MTLILKFEIDTVKMHQYTEIEVHSFIVVQKLQPE